MEEQALQFQEMLLKVQKSLSQEEMLDLVFLCTDLLRKDLSSVVTATELFSLLQKEDLLSSHDTSLLQELLTITRQNSLLQKLCICPRPTIPSHISSYRQLLFELAENISAEDLKSIKFLLNQNLPRKTLDKDLTVLQLFWEMEKGGLLAADNLEPIERIIGTVAPFLQRKVTQFKMNSGADIAPQDRTKIQDSSVTVRPVQPESIPQNMDTTYAAQQGSMLSKVMCPRSYFSQSWSEERMSLSSFSGDNVEGQIANLSLTESSGQAQSHHGRFSSIAEETSLSSPDPYQHRTLTLEEYDMKGDWRGFCLIINNYDFSKSLVSLNNREGTDADEKSLVNVFKWLRFKTEVVRDCDKKRMLKALQDLRNRDHRQADCVVCCVLTHGYDGGVYGVDGQKVELRELMKPLDGHHCASLIDKPKLFFIQACRGIQSQEVAFLQSDSMEQCVFSDALVPKESIPARADFLMAMATVPNFVSYREKVHGTWFIQTLCKNLQQQVPRGTDLLSILTQVNNDVSRKTDRSGTKKQIPQPEFTLRKRVVFPVPPESLPPS
ncbi:caspase-8 [Salminus brasiliensis]|uniref:caspase-8 n=1 Tax=Salminus brasiliensis TaxID=930266 RepID=UPI003B838CBF